MKKLLLLPFLVAFPLSLWSLSIDIINIVNKLEKVGKWQLPVVPDYPIYDPFKRVAPLLKPGQSHHFSPGRRIPRPVAILNEKAFIGGRWVKQGDRFGSVKVLIVRKDGVMVKEGGRILFLPLHHQRKLLHIKETKR